MRGYLNDSTAVTSARLAQIADWAAKIQVLNESNYADELINATDTPMFGFEATEQKRYDMGYRLFISNLFGLTPIDLEKIKRLELIRAALTCSTEELDALTATVRLMPTQQMGYPTKPIVNDNTTMSGAAVEVLPNVLESIDRELPPLEEWAQSSVDWTKANKVKPLDIPFQPCRYEDILNPQKTFLAAQALSPKEGGAFLFRLQQRRQNNLAHIAQTTYNAESKRPLFLSPTPTKRSISPAKHVRFFVYSPSCHDITNRNRGRWTRLHRHITGGTNSNASAEKRNHRHRTNHGRNRGQCARSGRKHGGGYLGLLPAHHLPHVRTGQVEVGESHGDVAHQQGGSIRVGGYAHHGRGYRP